MREFRPNKIVNFGRKRRGRIPIPKQTYYCRKCGYQSDRLFNVNRHAQRMHTKKINKLCCRILFFKKSDYYQHVEDYHPGTRPATTISKKKYKIYGCNTETSTNLTPDSSFEDAVNYSSKPAFTRRSMRILEREMNAEKPTLTEASTDSDSKDCNNDDSNNKDKSHTLDDIQDFIAKECNEDKFYIKQSIDRIESSLPSPETSSTAGYNIKYQSTFAAYENQEQKYNESMFDSASANLKIDVRGKSLLQLPIKKRILRDLSKDNIDNRQKSEQKIKKVTVCDKENQDPVDIFFNENRGVNVLRPILTINESIWDYITQNQRNYLIDINFDMF